MVTIYLDKHIFSHLFNGKDEKFIKLREKILSHKDEFIFLYSNGHLFDLQQDKTDTKYDEMEFIQSIVDGNHLIYENQRIGIAKETPSVAFGNIGKMNDYTWLDDFDFSQLTQEQCDAINNIIDISIKSSTGQLDFDWLTKREPISTDKPIINNDIFVPLIKSIAYNYFENKETYKVVRDKTITEYNPTMIIADDTATFNDRFISSPLGVPFVDIIKATLKQTGLSNADESTIYYISYMFLDLFGISKEKRKKVKYRNMQTDCLHSFFGSYCDCIVSDDIGIVNKSKALYKLYNIETYVYSTDEFIEAFDKAIKDNKKEPKEYLDEIIHDYRLKQITRTDELGEFKLRHLKSSFKYFGYFNCMLERKSDNETVIILHKNVKANRPLYFKEIEIVVNRYVKAFNTLGLNIEFFDNQKEPKQLLEDQWPGRPIEFKDIDVCLTKFPQAALLCCWIKLKK